MPSGEHRAPAQITVKTLGDYLEVMSKSVFQTGISWAVVEKKWPEIKEAFKGFDAAKVAGMSEKELAKLAEDPRVIRNKLKLAAVVSNARKIIELDDTHGSFRKYLRSHADYDALVKSLRKEFKYLGEIGAYVFLYAVKEKVPAYEEFRESRGLNRGGA